MTAPDLAVLLGDSRTEAARRAGLRRAKRGATGLLAAAAVVFLLTFLADDGEHGWVGFVRAAAEAGMVGGLADWFAVTALFRHPLGIPVPHTALVPRRKDALAASLGDFVTGHFLTAANVRARLREADVVSRIGTWLSSGDAADRLAREAVSSSAAVLDVLRPDDVADLLLEVASRDAAQRSWAALAGQLLADVTDEGAHRPVVEVALPYVRRSIEQNRPAVTSSLKRLVEGSSWLVWLFTTDRASTGSSTPASGCWPRSRPTRSTSCGSRWTASCAPCRPTCAAAGTWPCGSTRSPGRCCATRTPGRGWSARSRGRWPRCGRRWASPPGPAGPHRLLAAALGERAVHDPDLHARLEGLLERAVLHVVENYAAEFTRLVEDTVQRWDGPATADRIELAAGRDLQFIRINGTVVGALAGVVIHAVAVGLG
jgi:uncharacterized membrane-anchored protein YjiN (DUF445 family)